MYPVSDRYLAALRSYVRFVPGVELSLDWRTWVPLELSSGNVVADRTNQVRWNADLRVSGDSFEPYRDRAPYGGRIRVFSNVELLRGESFRLPLGVYRIDSTSDAGDGLAGLKGSSFEIECQEAGFLTPRALPDFPGQTIRQAVETLISEAVPDARFEWHIDADDDFPSLVEESDRWGLIDGDSTDVSFAKALGAEVYCDAQGTFVVRAVPDVRGPAVWSADRGRDGVLVSADRAQSRVGVANVWVVSGARDDGSAPIGPGFAWDDDSNSPLYAGPDPVGHPELAGQFGVKPAYYTSSLIASADQCAVVAEALLRAHLGLQRTVAFTSVNNPALEPGDVVSVEVTPGRHEHHLLDKLAFELGSGTVQADTRMVET